MLIGLLSLIAVGGLVVYILYVAADFDNKFRKKK